MPDKIIKVNQKIYFDPVDGHSHSGAEGDGRIVTGGSAPGSPSATVVAETAFGVASAVGVAASYSRGDHTHGSPTNPVTGHETTYDHVDLVAKKHANTLDHANTNDPSADQKAALAGSSGTPSVTNKYVTDGDARNSDARTPLAHNQAFSTITATPTTLAGYGITDAAPSSQGVTNGNTHDHVGGDGAQIAHTGLSGIGTNTHAQIDTHLASVSNPHSVTAAQAGALATSAFSGLAKITVGLTAPSSPVTGDLWIDTN